MCRGVMLLVFEFRHRIPVILTTLPDTKHAGELDDIHAVYQFAFGIDAPQMVLTDWPIKGAI